ncbi:hypothetical protein [Clostridium thermobutyricum]|uniref:hypothetical protein n=1 Tax=Clostridium thermobutyricum TaxID=29372 RepID=UPI0018AABB45|nr:hypothetical protein [Clostridium thermobutyricum]
MDSFKKRKSYYNWYEIVPLIGIALLIIIDIFASIYVYNLFKDAESLQGVNSNLLSNNTPIGIFQSAPVNANTGLILEVENNIHQIQSQYYVDNKFSNNSFGELCTLYYNNYNQNYVKNNKNANSIFDSIKDIIEKIKINNMNTHNIDLNKDFSNINSNINTLKSIYKEYGNSSN